MDSFKGARALITGGLGFIGSNLARRLVRLGAQVTLVDSLIPTYGGNPHNIHDIRSQLTVNVCDVRDPFVMWSDDGRTWSEPALVTDAPPRYDDWFPEVAVARTGEVYAAWYDWRASPEQGCGCASTV